MLMSSSLNTNKNMYLCCESYDIYYHIYRIWFAINDVYYSKRVYCLYETYRGRIQ